MAQHLNAGEFIKRLATASGIDALGLVKGQEQMQQEGEQMKQDAMQASLVGQAGQLAKSPMAEQLTQQMQDGQQQQQPPETPEEASPEA
jgi:hypothetical protein